MIQNEYGQMYSTPTATHLLVMSIKLWEAGVNFILHYSLFPMIQTGLGNLFFRIFKIYPIFHLFKLVLFFWVMLAHFTKILIAT